MRNRVLVSASALLIMLLIVVVGMTGCSKEKKSAESEKQTTTTGAVTDTTKSPGGAAQTATDASRQTQTTREAETAQTPAGGTQTPAGGERKTGDQPQATGDTTSGKAATSGKDTGNFKYVGVTACAVCHKGPSHGSIYEVWLGTKHAKAYENLGADNQGNDVCLGCHTTGHGKPLAAGVTPAKMVNVQCEACHGPGSDYKAMAIMKNRPEALKRGLILPTKERCLGCHGGKFPAGHPEVAFNYESALLKIEHHMKPTEPAK